MNYNEWMLSIPACAIPNPIQETLKMSIKKKMLMCYLFTVSILEKVRTCLESNEQWSGFAQRAAQSKKLLLLD